MGITLGCLPGERGSMVNIHMDYQKHYLLLIERARARKLDVYTETHHVIPRCVGGANTKDNLVELLPEEHFLAHQLLVKMYPTSVALAIAATMMSCNGSHQKRSNKQYAWLKKRHAAAMKILQSGKLNSQYGSVWITNGVKNKKIKKGNDIPSGWWVGRIINQKKFQHDKEKKKLTAIKKDRLKEKYTELLLFYKNNNMSLAEMSLMFDIKKSTLQRGFERYFGKNYLDWPVSRVV